MGLGRDPLADALDCLVKLGLDETLCRRALAETRRRWGGGQVYIPAHDRPARDAVIDRALDAGLPVREVAARAQTSVSTVKRRRSEWYR
ncbi:MAG: hypothetical protein KAX46_11430 [Chromatiaceae bacterium]|nr:hypothetical protein [Chromatiaceae bacterium]